MREVNGLKHAVTNQRKGARGIPTRTRTWRTNTGDKRQPLTPAKQTASPPAPTSTHPNTHPQICTYTFTHTHPGTSTHPPIHTHTHTFTQTWQPFVLGPLLAILKRPGWSCLRSKFSSGKAIPPYIDITPVPSLCVGACGCMCTCCVERSRGAHERLAGTSVLGCVRDPYPY